MHLGNNIITIYNFLFRMLIIFLSIAVKANNEMQSKIRRKFNHTMPPSVYKKVVEEE